jgi:MFS family permease
MNRLWAIIICGGAIVGLSVGIRQSFGLFLTPISEHLSLGREVFALSIGLINLLWGIFAPLTGAVADKFGPTRVVLAGTLLYCSGLYIISNAVGPAELIAAGALIGVGMSGLGFTVVLGAVGRAAPPEKRSMALGLASMGGSIGQFVAIPYAHVLIGQIGWSSSLLFLLATAALMAPLAWGLSGKQDMAEDSLAQTLGQAVREAVHHRGFVLLTAGFFVCGFHVTFVATHLPSYLSDKSFDPSLGATALTLVGLANIFGVVAAGYVGQIIEKRLVLSVYYLLRSFIFLVFILSPLSETSVLIFAFCLGLLWLGTVPLTSGLVATLFGPRYMSTLFGIVFMSHQFGGFLGAWLGGYIYDLFGSYLVMWWLSIALGIVSALLHWPIREEAVSRVRVDQEMAS